MTQVYFAIPGDIDTPTGGYAYDRRVMALLPDFGVSVTHLPLPGGFPFPTEAELQEAADRLALVPSHSVLLADGLAFGALPEWVLLRILAPVAVLLHHPLGLETGIGEAESRALIASERTALRFARQVIVTSPTTAETLNELGFAPPPPVTIAEPGTEPGARATGSGAGGCQILSVGAVVPRKGHDLLIAALADLTHLDWRCVIAGSLDRDGGFARQLLARVEETGLTDRITFAGALSAAELGRHYSQADLFALPSRYEGYGMAFAEALARGLPVVAARAGAVPGTVPPDAGILTPPEDVGALRDALACLIADASRRKEFSDAAWMHAQKLPRWAETVRIIADVIKRAQL